MDVLTDKQNLALVSFAFLQADCGNAEYRQELLSLGQELNIPSDVNLNGFREECHSEDGYLETDGHICSSHSAFLLEIEPFVPLAQPGEFKTPRYFFFLDAKCSRKRYLNLK